MKVAIIGAGLAGTALAHILKQHVSDLCVYEGSEALASGASGNEIGLINPRFSAHRTAESDYFTSAFAMAQRVFPVMADIDWNPCGALHLITDEKKAKRFPQTVENWGWPEGQMRLVNAEEASEIAGVPLKHQALYLPQSACVSPRKLCKRYAEGVRVETGVRIESLSDTEADLIVLACGLGVKGFKETEHLPLQGVRGQVTQFKAQALADLKVSLCYGGYCAPAKDGVHTVGATFQRWLDHDDVMLEDNAENLGNLTGALPFDMGAVDITGQRAGVRCTTKDHFPIVGAVRGRKNLYVSCGHGSHGILSTLAGSQLLGDMILGRPYSQSLRVVDALSPARFG